jgi:excisionase family DNA binding protein
MRRSQGSRWSTGKRSTLADRLLTVAEVAELLSVSTRTVRNRIASGRLAVVQERPGAALRVPSSSVDAYVDSITRPAIVAVPSASPGLGTPRVRPTASRRRRAVEPERGPGNRVVRLHHRKRAEAAQSITR